MNHNRFHDQPTGLIAMTQPATYLTIHGTRDQLAAIADAIEADAPVLNSLGPVECEPAFDCHVLHIVVLGDYSDTDLDTILAAIRYTAARANAHLN